MRTFTKFANEDPRAKVLVEELPTLTKDVNRYRQNMTEIGQRLALHLVPNIANSKSDTQVCVVCTVEDADFLARGIIDSLDAEGFGAQVKLICMWNDHVSGLDVSISPITREYRETLDPGREAIFIIVKSIISSACVVKTNLSRAISYIKPSTIFVAAPVMLKGAEERLKDEFPDSVADKFSYVCFAIDDEKNGDYVKPGIGGSVYELLGLGDQQEKNRYIPTIVKTRRSERFGSGVVAQSN